MAVSRNSFAPRSSGATSTGLIVLDHGAEPIYLNAEAVKVLSYSQGSEHPAKLTNSLPPEIRRAIGGNPPANCSSFEAEFKSGRRIYRYRVCPLIRNSKAPLKGTIAILIDRVSSNSVNVIGIAEEFHLTEREQETARLLTEGLTSKEIASRMNVSPNTVKTFVHLIMAKMAVTTRSGIVGKLLRT
jgi:DNA-binding NarL/FixJ family response regulator